MFPRNTLLTLALCFGLGLGFAKTIRFAHASSCIDQGYWRLALEKITGQDDAGAEAAYWTAEASFTTDDSEANLYLVLDLGGISLELERLP